MTEIELRIDLSERRAMQKMLDTFPIIMAVVLTYRGSTQSIVSREVSLSYVPAEIDADNSNSIRLEYAGLSVVVDLIVDRGHEICTSGETSHNTNELTRYINFRLTTSR